jgi:NDP-sugar pyrophosphorylase family protein
MQAVILAAGRGTRMGGLTDELPKPLLEVAGKSLLEHKFDVLPSEIDEIIIIVGYMGSKIQERFGGNYNGKRILYVEQEVLDGTMGALARAKDILTDRFIVMMGDDLYSKNDIETCIAIPDWVMLVEEMEQMNSGGRVIVDDEGAIVDIEEGNHTGTHGLANTNMLVLDTQLFRYPMIPKAAGSNEFGLPQTVLAASKSGGIPFEAVPATFWFQITAPEDLEKAEKILASL